MPRARKGTAPRYLWYCTRCRNSVAAVAEPSERDACRICIDCSVETGAVRSRHRAGLWRGPGEPSSARPGVPGGSRFVCGGIDLRDELARLVALPHVPPEVKADPPALEVVRKHEMGGQCGFATSRNRIEVHTWPGIHTSFAVATLVHEFAHIVVWPGKPRTPAYNSAPGKWHDDAWRSALVELVREGYAVDPPFIRSPSGESPAWMLDLSVEIAVAYWLGATLGQKERLCELLTRVYSEVQDDAIVYSDLSPPPETKEP